MASAGITLTFTPYAGYQSVATIINDNIATMDYVRMDISWGSANPDPFDAPHLLLIMDLHFTHKISGETNRPLTSYRSVLSAPLTVGAIS